MKIQCACGTKYSFEVTPEMAAAPIRFVCQNCGADNSTVVNQLIRQQLGVEVPPSAPRPAVAPAPVIAPPPPSQRASVAPTVQAAPAAPVIRVAPAATTAPASGGGPSAPPPAGPAPLRVSAPAASAAAAAPAVDAPQVCTKHAGQLTTHHCLVCQKPICPQCMALFGFVCSAYCKGKAESQGMDVPVYAGQRDVAQSRQWRKVGLISLAVALLVAAALGAWGWYAWVGSVPSVAFSTRFTEPGYSGQVRVCAPDQVVFLHGGTLARHDMKAKKELWSQVLIDKPRISQEADKAYEEWKASWQKAQAAGADMSQWHYVTRDELHDSMLRAAAEVLHLHVRGENIWVAAPGKLTRYEWPTGKPVQEIPMSEEREELTARGDELLLVAARPAGGRELTRINLASGESRAEDIDPPPPSAMAKSAGSARPGQTASRRAATNQLAAADGTGKAGPIPPGAKPLDPAALAAKYENLPRPAKLALPAVVAAGANQQRLQAALRDEDSPPPAALTALAAAAAALRNTAEADGRVILTPEGAVRISMRLLEAKTIERKVMKERPAKSAFDGPINQAATAAIANELLNDMQRDRGADVVEEDVSRYQVTVRRAAGQDTMEWTGEVTGSADFIPLQTVDVVVGGKALIVLDKKMKKLWEARLNYDVRAAPERGPDGELPPDGDGPCVERGDTLYVFDAGVLTAFDLASGNVRWRLPSVETKGLFFDDADMIYVNTTSATPDNLKYSRQIDVTDKIHPVVLKVEAKTGKTLWRVNNEGTVNYVSGKLVYTAESHPGDDDEADGLLGVNTIFHVPAHVRIKRLDAGNGRVLWQHYQPRYPLDVRYDQNSIHLLFKKEVQILKFIYL